MSNEKDIEYYMNLDWTLVEGTDLDFNGNTYHYIEIAEIPSFAYCAKTQELARANYKTQLKWTLQVMLSDPDCVIREPGDEDDDDVDWESLCP